MLGAPSEFRTGGRVSDMAAARCFPVSLIAQARVAAATAAFIGFSWLAGAAITPQPLTSSEAVATGENDKEKRPLVVPVVIERSVYVK